MISSQKMRIRGIPCPKVKSTGNSEGPQKRTEAIVERTKGLPKVTGPCLHLPKEKFHEKNPFGTNLDNLLKRFLDALSQTVFCDAPGQDACVVSLEATKVLAGA